MDLNRCLISLYDIFNLCIICFIHSNDLARGNTILVRSTTSHKRKGIIRSDLQFIKCCNDLLLLVLICYRLLCLIIINLIGSPICFGGFCIHDISIISFVCLRPVQIPGCSINLDILLICSAGRFFFISGISRHIGLNSTGIRFCCNCSICVLL